MGPITTSLNQKIQLKKVTVSRSISKRKHKITLAIIMLMILKELFQSLWLKIIEFMKNHQIYSTLQKVMKLLTNYGSQLLKGPVDLLNHNPPQWQRRQKM